MSGNIIQQDSAYKELTLIKDTQRNILKKQALEQIIRNEKALKRARKELYKSMI